MPNLYNTPKQSQFMQSYVSQYVPLPFEEMQKSLLLKQGQYDKAEEYVMTAQEEFAGIKGIEGKDSEYLAEKNAKLNEFVSSIEGKDLASPDILKSIRSTVRTMSKDPNLITIKNNMDKVREFQENYKKAIADGDVRPENMYHFTDALEAYKKGGFEMGDLPDPTIYKGVDEFTGFKKYFEMMSPEERQSIGSLSYDNSEGGGNAYYTTTTKGRSAKRVSQQVINVLEDARNSPEGQQALRRYAMEMGRAGKPVTSEGAMQYLASQVAAVGQGYIYESTTSDKASALNKKDENQSKFMNGTTQLFQTKVIEGANGLEYDERGNIVRRKGMTAENVAKTVWENGISGLFDGRTSDAIAEYISGSKGAKEAMQGAPKIIVAAAANGVSPRDIVDESMKTRSFDTKDYIKAGDRDNASKLLFDKGAGTWINTTMVDKKGNRIPARQAITQALDLDWDAPIGEINEKLEAAGGISVLGNLVPGNPIAAKGAHVNLGGESYIVDYTNLYRPTSSKDIAQWEKDLAAHDRAKRQTELVVEGETVDAQGNLIKVYDIWNFKKNTFIPYTQQEFNKLFKDQLQKVK